MSKIDELSAAVGAVGDTSVLSAACGPEEPLLREAGHTAACPVSLPGVADQSGNRLYHFQNQRLGFLRLYRIKDASPGLFADGVFVLSRCRELWFL
ncbi:MAG: hypothetical protein ACI9KD_002314 [Congregibacter sp.]|jgi:hypothetical protein